MQVQSEILRLHQTLNANVFPVPCGSKVPARSWKVFSRKKLSVDEIKALFAEQQGANIAVVTGQVSNLIVLDADSKRALAHIREAGVPVTPIAESARGRHYYFSAQNAKICTANLARDLQLKAEGAYVLAPPSVHPSGKRYEWILPPWECEPAPPPPRWLLSLIEQQRRKHTSEKFEVIVRGVPEGRRNISSASLIGLLLAHLPSRYWNCAWELVKAWNLRNRPPLDERQLRYTFDSIARKELGKRCARDERQKDLHRKLARFLAENFSQRALAHELGVSRTTIARLLQSWT